MDEKIGREAMVDMGQDRPVLALVARTVEAGHTLLILDAAGRPRAVIVERDQQIAIFKTHDAGIVQVYVSCRVLKRDLGKLHAITLPLTLHDRRRFVGSARR